MDKEIKNNIKSHPLIKREKGSSDLFDLPKNKTDKSYHEPKMTEFHEENDRL